MAYKEVFRVEIAEVIRRWQAGESQRHIAEGTGLARDTVSKYIASAERLGLSRDGPVPSEEQLSKLAAIGRAGPRRARTPIEDRLGPWTDQIQRWVVEDRLQLTRIRELLLERGCEVSYPSVQRFVARRNWRGRSTRTVRMAESPPGEVAEMDFGRLGFAQDPETGRRRTVWALIVVLAYSRHSFVWPTHGQKLEDVVAGLEAAWAFFDGIPKYLVIDNFPAAVAGADALHPRLTRGFLEYSQRRGFITDPARVRHPRDKPKVERGVQYVRERFFKGADFRDLPHMRKEALHWCREVAGQRVHGTTRRKPVEVFDAEERQTLLPWDGEPYEVTHWRNAKVQRDHHVTCQNALYSVPSALCLPGQQVEIALDSKLVRIYHQGKLIKVHPRQSKGRRSTDPDDYPKEFIAYTLRAPDKITQSAAELGEAVAAFADRLFEGPTPWAKVRQGHKLLRLAQRYTPDRLNDACRKALDVDLIDVHRVERILIEALEQQDALPYPDPLPTGRFARPGSVFALVNGHHPNATPQGDLT